MAITVYESRAFRAWKMVHEDKISAKKAAAAIGVSLADIYEYLGYCKQRIDIISFRKTTYSAITKYNDASHNAGKRSAAKPLKATDGI